MQVKARHSATTSPLSKTVARISGLADYIDCRIGIPDESGWHRLSDLDDPELLGAWHLQVSEQFGDRRVAAAFMSNWLVSYLSGGWLMPVLAERRLPLANHAEIAIRRNSGGWFDAYAVDDAAVAVLPDDPEAEHPSATVLSDADQMFDALTDRLLSLEPVIAALRSACPIGLPALWGSLADGIGGNALLLAELLESDRHGNWQVAEAINARLAERQPRLRTLPRPFPVPHEGSIRLFSVRGTCCLYYRTVENPDRNGKGYCSGCPLRPDESRLYRLQAWLRGELDDA